MLSYKQKHAQANREARATVVALAITIAVWAVCGFGLSGLDVQIFHTPLWVVGGTIGTWVCSIIVVVVLAKKIFLNYDLDDESLVAEEKEACHE
ncbi:MAG: YhdT family protein [Eggerthellales bacterium]|nr:YhdT family protein [Eggerthellales bacterium]